jgi:hypothetical protein
MKSLLSSLALVGCFLVACTDSEPSADADTRSATETTCPATAPADGAACSVTVHCRWGTGPGFCATYGREFADCVDGKWVLGHVDGCDADAGQ